MKDYLQIIENNREEMLQTLKEFVAIPSVATAAEGEYPFGSEVQKAFEFILSTAEKDGFTTKNVDNYGGHIDFPGKTDEIVAMVGHVDVVPAGDLTNWRTDPYKAEIIDGRIYGRGTIDDKGPLLAGYYAMKALKEAGFKPQRTIRVILGLDEETEWKGIEYYMAREKAPVAGFSPDADFPVIHGEKGLIIFDLLKKFSGEKRDGLQLVKFTGGSVPNAVADGALAVISFGNKKEYVSEKITEYIKTHKYDIKVTEGNQTAEITVKGVSAHAANPELGLNAISILFELLGNIEFDNEEVNEAIAFYNKHIGFDVHGERIGACLSDEPSGNLAFNTGILSFDENEMRITINIRYPVTFDLDDVYAGIEKVAEPLGVKVERVDCQPPLYKPIDDPMIEALMETYAKFTGDMESKPIVIGGATYARAVPNTVAFGPVMPGKPDLCHQANEYADIEELITSTKIFAEALYKLAG